jgi:Mn-dependent DtxR family transcriptional regulator
MIHESGEDYLETILIIKNRKGYVRAVDIADTRSISRPSVSRAVSVLQKNGLITIAPDGAIDLTAEGSRRAKDIYERHLFIRKLFTDVLGVSEKTAEADACKIEHALSDETYSKLKELIQNSSYKIQNTD